MVTLDDSAKAALKMGEGPILCAQAASLRKIRAALEIYDIDTAQVEIGAALDRIERRMRINAALLSGELNPAPQNTQGVEPQRGIYAK